MIQVEIQESSPRFQNFVEEDSNEERRLNLDLLDEVREEARLKAEGRQTRSYITMFLLKQFEGGTLFPKEGF